MLTQDPWVLQTVQGFQIPLVLIPVQVSPPPQIHLSVEQQDVVSTKVQPMVQKEAVSVILPHEGEFVSQIFLVPKKDGNHQPVVSLKFLNKFIVVQDGGLPHNQISGETR